MYSKIGEEVIDRTGEEISDPSLCVRKALVNSSEFCPPPKERQLLTSRLLILGPERVKLDRAASGGGGTVDTASLLHTERSWWIVVVASEQFSTVKVTWQKNTKILDEILACLLSLRAQRTVAFWGGISGRPWGKPELMLPPLPDLTEGLFAANWCIFWDEDETRGTTD